MAQLLSFEHRTFNAFINAVAKSTKRIASEAQEEGTALHEKDDADETYCTATSSCGRAQNRGIVQQR